GTLGSAWPPKSRASVGSSSFVLAAGLPVISVRPKLIQEAMRLLLYGSGPGRETVPTPELLLTCIVEYERKQLTRWPETGSRGARFHKLTNRPSGARSEMCIQSRPSMMFGAGFFREVGCVEPRNGVAGMRGSAVAAFHRVS